VSDYGRRDLLRFLTCGSVDDGKSTLIGRLLHDADGLFDDQLEALQRSSAHRGDGTLELAHLLDGLAAEREQGITIDVAYRYFATPRRKFIIADTPGHEQYTRNMATGASSCDLAVILVDATRGVLDQTRRHAFIASLLGIQHLVVAVNKMDRVGFSPEPFEAVRAELTDFAARLEIKDLHFVPVAALPGDNVVVPSVRMPWYQGSTLLHHLESVHIASDRNLIDLRFPVQLVLRVGARAAGAAGGSPFSLPAGGLGGSRGYAGTVASGVLRRGMEVLALPSGRHNRVRSVATFDGELGEAFPPMAVVVTLEEEIDLARGDVLVAPHNVPQLDHAVEAMLVWMDPQPLAPGRQVLVKHTTVQTPATVTDLRYRLDMRSLHREQAHELGLNEIGRVRLEHARPLAFDPYSRNRATGALILIDRLTNRTLAAGVILGQEIAESVTTRRPAADAGTQVRAAPVRSQRPVRAQGSAQRPVTVWLTGLPRAGKTSIAYGLEERLLGMGHDATALDGEALRHGLSSDLGFTPRDRRENVRRAAEVARLLNDQGLIVLASFVSPSAEDRALASSIIGPERFLEVWCSAPLAACEARDSDSLFARARAGELANVTGIDAPYEPPATPALELPTHRQEVAESVEAALALLRERGFLS
jgi:bifunctional enzyme CysN/CysC